MAKLYALIVGIDSYPSPDIPKLYGCVNDAQAMGDFLSRRYTAPAPNVLSLINEQATRAGVVDGFRKHLGRAEAGDVALFFYAGHGSEEKATGEDGSIESTGKNQTIVCFDSRNEGGLDLVDKELHQLLEELTSRGVHMTVVEDCCHSGSGTRGLTAVATRQAPGRTRSLAEGEAPAKAGAPDSIVAGAPDSMVAGARAARSGSHVAMAACDSSELANEYLVGAVHRGAFSYFLLQELNACSSLPNSIDLMQRVRPRLKAQVFQNPQLAGVGGDEGLRNVFLGATPSAATDVKLVTYKLASYWEMDAGSTLLLSVGDSVALYPLEAGAGDLADPAKALVTAKLARVKPGTSVLNVADATKLDPQSLYAAVITSRGARVEVRLEGDEEGLALLRAELGKSVYVQEGTKPRFGVTAAAGEFRFSAAMAGNPLPAAIPQTADGAAMVLRALDHMAKWTALLELQNPASNMAADAVGFTIIECGKPGEPQRECRAFDRLELAYAAGSVQPPTFKLLIKNRSAQRLYFTLLSFSQSWRISAELIAEGCILLQPGDSVYPYGDQKWARPIPAMVRAPATEALDELLLIASTEAIVASDLEQPRLAEVLRGLRGAAAGEPAPLVNDFQTRRLQVHTVRSL